MHPDQSFAEHRVLITGGTSGIGLAIAKALAVRGARVAVCGRDLDRLRQAEALLPGLLAIPCDVCREDEVTRLLDTVKSAFGGLDIFISNAGRLIEHDFVAAPPDGDPLKAELELNFVAPIVMTARVLPLMSGPHPAIVMITSGYALVSPTRAPTYGAAKAGLRGFLQGLRRQLKGRALVMEVLPPTVDTPATAHRDLKKISADAVAAALIDGLARGRDEIRLGQVDMLPLLLRLAPRLVDRVVGRS